MTHDLEPEPAVCGAAYTPPDLYAATYRLGVRVLLETAAAAGVPLHDFQDATFRELDAFAHRAAEHFRPFRQTRD